MPSEGSPISAYRPGTVSIVNVFVTGAVVLLDPTLRLLAWVGLAELVAIGAITAAASRAPGTRGAAHADAAHAAAGH